jgi:hypothetical protein
MAVGVMFLYTGYNKARNPYDFLKLLNEYALFPPDGFRYMNFVAITLPWLEIFCGVRNGPVDFDMKMG